MILSSKNPKNNKKIIDKFFISVLFHNRIYLNIAHKIAKYTIMKDDIEKTATEIGRAMLENGAEINRCEDTIKRLLISAERQYISVFCISSLIIVQTEYSTRICRITRNDLDLFEIDEANSKSRAICSGDEFQPRYNRYSNLSKILLTFLSTGSFCIFFGGSFYDALVSGFVGLIINNIKINISNVFPKTLCYSVIGGILCLIPCYIFDNLHLDKIMIGTIMLLIPGLTIGKAIKDIMSSDIISGIMELTEAVFTAIAISLGYGVALAVFTNV